MRHAAPASGPTSRNRAMTPDQAMIAVPAIKANQPTRSTPRLAAAAARGRRGLANRRVSHCRMIAGGRSAET
jgi:hypothetical protein